MTKKLYEKELKNLIDAIVDGMREKKGHDIVILNLQQLQTSPADIFIICHGDSTKQVEAIANSVDDVVKQKTGEDAWHVEGMQNAEWVLLDYINVVAHVFLNEKRTFYGIEQLWGDAIFTNIKD